MSDSIYKENFKLMVQLGMVLESGVRTYSKSVSGGFMDLTVESVEMLNHYIGPGYLALSMVHYFIQNGDLCQDPEMVVFVHMDKKEAEAFSFQQAIPPIYQEVYSSPETYNKKLKNDLNAFLHLWLSNLVSQGHGQNWIDKEG